MTQGGHDTVRVVCVAALLGALHGAQLLLEVLDLVAQTHTFFALVCKLPRSLRKFFAAIGEFLLFAFIRSSLRSEQFMTARYRFYHKGTLIICKGFSVACKILFVLCEFTLTFAQSFYTAALINVLGNLYDALVREDFFFRSDKLRCFASHLIVCVLPCMTQDR